MFSMINQFSIVKYAISTPAPENFAGMGRGHFLGGVFPCLAVSSINESKQRCTRGYKRYKETSGLIEWKERQIFHSIFT